MVVVVEYSINDIVKSVDEIHLFFKLIEAACECNILLIDREDDTAVDVVSVTLENLVDGSGYSLEFFFRFS